MGTLLVGVTSSVLFAKGLKFDGSILFVVVSIAAFIWGCAPYVVLAALSWRMKQFWIVEARWLPAAIAAAAFALDCYLRVPFLMGASNSSTGGIIIMIAPALVSVIVLVAILCLSIKSR